MRLCDQTKVSFSPFSIAWKMCAIAHILHACSCGEHWGYVTHRPTKSHCLFIELMINRQLTIDRSVSLKRAGVNTDCKLKRTCHQLQDAHQDDPRDTNVKVVGHYKREAHGAAVSSPTLPLLPHALQFIHTFWLRLGRVRPVCVGLSRFGVFVSSFRQSRFSCHRCVLHRQSACLKSVMVACMRSQSSTETSPAPQQPSSRAVMYVRMSTDLQQYSIENQSDYMRAYADMHGHEIIRVYPEEGESGLTLAGRPQMQQLLIDVQGPTRDFDTILVYDISRWGRFPDDDEGAAYEHLCRKAGVSVIYVAEEFANDGSMFAGVYKAIKRTMASGYSKDLSLKVFIGQCRLIRLGYRQGGHAGYGLRRMLIDLHGRWKGELAYGERKSLQTDRVILIPGPQEEVDIVRWIYQQFVDDGLPEVEIAMALNARGVMTDMEHPWTRGTVHQVLTNEKYIDHNVFNRRSFKLKKIRVANNPQDYIRADNAFTPIIDEMLFTRARQMITARAQKLTDDELLATLTEIYHRHGRLTAIIIDECEDTPSSSVYAQRFGGLLRAYRLVGYTPAYDCAHIAINRQLRAWYPTFCTQIVTQLQEVGALVSHNTTTGLMRINGEFTLAIVIARCQATDSGRLRWIIRLDTGLTPDFHLVVRMDVENAAPRDYYLFSTLDISGDRLRLATENPFYLDAYRSDTLEQLLALSRHITV